MKKPLVLLLVFALLVLTVVGGVAAYYALKLPDPASLELQEHVDRLQSILRTGTQEELNEALQGFSDEELLNILAEVSLQLEATGEMGAMAAFNEVAKERISKSIDADTLDEILTDEGYPYLFKKYMTELGLFASMQAQEAGISAQKTAFSATVKKALANWSKLEDQLVMDLFATLKHDQWVEGDFDLMYSIYSQSESTSNASLGALQNMGFANPDKAKQVYYETLDHYREEEGLTMLSVMLGISRMVETKPDLYADAPQKVQAFLEDYLASGFSYPPAREPYTNTGDDFTMGLISWVGMICGETQTPGVPALLNKYQERVPMDSRSSFIFWSLSENLFWEIDDMLLSDSDETLELALYYVSAQPFEYYIDSLRELAQTRDDRLGRQAAKLADLAEQERLPLTMAHLATK